MTVHMKPGQWDFFWDWHVASPDLTLADMLRIIREEKEAEEAAAAADDEEEMRAWNLHQEAAVEEAVDEMEWTAADELEWAAAYEGVDSRAAVADRLEADAIEAEAAARAYRAMTERLRMQMAMITPVTVDRPQQTERPQTWMERFKAQKAAAPVAPATQADLWTEFGPRGLTEHTIDVYNTGFLSDADNDLFLAWLATNKWGITFQCRDAVMASPIRLAHPPDRWGDMWYDSVHVS
jgi:hypothetical protein